MNQKAASTSKWNAADYAKVGAFVAELAGAALDLLDPQPGERILDVGCGEGTLTRKIIERGATVLGIDNSPEMIAAARANGIDAVQLAAEDMTFLAEFDAAFSNATLHWVLEKEQAARPIQALGPYPGTRPIPEMDPIRATAECTERAAPRCWGKRGRPAHAGLPHPLGVRPATPGAEPA